MSDIIIPKKRFVVPLHQLARLALRYVYTKDSMSSSDVGIMQRSIVFWQQKINKTEVEEDSLTRIGAFLQKNADGKLAKRKDLFARHKINPFLFHRTPDMKELGDA